MFAVLLFDEDLAEADEAHPLDEVEMERGDAFWFSPTWYQTVSFPLPTSVDPAVIMMLMYFLHETSGIVRKEAWVAGRRRQIRWLHCQVRRCFGY